MSMLAVIARGERLMLTSLNGSPLIDVGAMEELPISSILFRSLTLRCGVSYREIWCKLLVHSLLGEVLEVIYGKGNFLVF